MSLGRGLFRSIPVKMDGPTRPSTFHETVSERTEDPALDYPSTADDAALDKPEDYGYREFADEPVPVYVSAPIPSDRPLREWSAGTLTLAVGTVSEIGAGDRNRSRMLVRNLDAANRLVLLRNTNDDPMMGYVVPAGQEIEITHTSPVRVRAIGGSVEISYLVEYIVEEIDS